MFGMHHSLQHSYLEDGENRTIKHGSERFGAPLAECAFAYQLGGVAATGGSRFSETAEKAVARGDCAGRRTVKSAPPPGLESNVRRPPWASTIPRLMESPSPMPLALVLQNGTKSLE